MILLGFSLPQWGRAPEHGRRFSYFYNLKLIQYAMLLADRDGNHPLHYRNMMLSDFTNCSRHIPPEKSGK